MPMFSNIPYELQTYNQWVMWKFVTLDNGKITKVPFQPNGQHANVMDSSTWTDFNTAINTKGFDGIGFVLTHNDPFCFIDLDDTTDPNVLEQQRSIYQNFADTYAELSPSGKGLHIICKAVTEQGCKRSGVELYSNARFMTMTGNIYNKKPIIDYQANINTLYRALTKDRKDFQVVNQKQHISDEELIAVASSAKNGQKFTDLYEGRYGLYYKSQSEADHALINIIGLYSRNIEQIVRIFRASALGKRDKAKRDNYVMDMVKNSFDNYIPPINVEELAEKVRLAKQNYNSQLAKPVRGKPVNLKLLTLPQLFPNEIAVIDQSEPLPDLKNVPFSYSEQSMNVDFDTLPDGSVKEIARFIYAQAPRPVKTIAMITALAFMSGICGRSYNISGTGLNNYFVLLAPTGIGKEGISKGINRMIASITPQQPMATKFLGIGELVSGISLLRYLSEESNCCLTVQGEFGLTMQRMTGRLANAPMLQLRKILLELYGKSGKGEVMRGSVYADTNKNIKEIEAPAFSLLGESTPETFYEALSESLVDEGLISRLNIIECSAIRPPLNKEHYAVQIPPSLQQWILTLVSNSLTLNATNTVINVEINEQAQRMLDDFDKFCDNTINNTSDESYRQLWNRGHLKALKISALFAVGDNMYKPIVTVEHVKYAIKFVQDSIATIYNRYSKNEIGAGSVSETKQVVDVCAIFRRFLLNPDRIKFPHPLMKEHYVFPAQDIMRATTSYKSFKSAVISKAELFKRAITVLETWGVIEEVKKYDLIEKYNYRGKAYSIIMPNYFLKEEYLGLMAQSQS
jgi:hypothetical protein